MIIPPSIFTFRRSTVAACGSEPTTGDGSAKICKDCVHYRNKWDDFTAFCLRTKQTNIVTGEQVFKTCRLERDKYGACGTDAKHFEPKRK